MNPEINKEELYKLTVSRVQRGVGDYEIEQELLMKGMNQEEAQKLIKFAKNGAKASAREMNEDGGSGIGGIFIWIGVLALVNILSYVFDWPFWIY